MNQVRISYTRIYEFLNSLIRISQYLSLIVPSAPENCSLSFAGPVDTSTVSLTASWVRPSQPNGVLTYSNLVLVCNSSLSGSDSGKNFANQTIPISTSTTTTVVDWTAFPNVQQAASCVLKASWATFAMGPRATCLLNTPLISMDIGISSLRQMRLLPTQFLVTL